MKAQFVYENISFERRGINSDVSHKEILKTIGIGGIRPGDLFFVKKKIITKKDGYNEPEYPVSRGGWNGYSQYDKDEILRIKEPVKYIDNNEMIVAFTVYRSYHAALEERSGWTTDVGGDTSYMKIVEDKFEEHFEIITEKNLPVLLKRLWKMRPNTKEEDI